MDGPALGPRPVSGGRRSPARLPGPRQSWCRSWRMGPRGAKDRLRGARDDGNRRRRWLKLTTPWDVAAPLCWSGEVGVCLALTVCARRWAQIAERGAHQANRHLLLHTGPAFADHRSGDGTRPRAARAVLKRTPSLAVPECPIWHLYSRHLASLRAAAPRRRRPRRGLPRRELRLRGSRSATTSTVEFSWSPATADYPAAPGRSSAGGSSGAASSAPAPRSPQEFQGSRVGERSSRSRQRTPSTTG